MITKSTVDNWTLTDTVAILGNFDGIHKGHQLLISTAKEYAAQKGLKTVVLTFLPHPSKHFGVNNFKLVYTEQEKETLFSTLGIDYFVIFPFHEESRSMSPEAFLKGILQDKLGVKAVVVGSDFRFGKKAVGNVELMKEYFSPLGIEVMSLSKMQSSGDDISSTRLRNEVSQGNLDAFEMLTGRKFHITGEIIHGKKLGRKIGFPTANILPSYDKLLPPNGVYLTEIVWRGRKFSALTNVGISPSLEDRPYAVESYILDFEEDIYGEIMDVYFIRYLRPEIQFDSIEELKIQIQKDVSDITNKK